MFDLKKKTVFSYLNIVSGILCLAVLIFGTVSKGFAGHTFSVAAALLLGLALVASIASFLLDYSFRPLVSALFVAIAFGVLIYFCLPIFADKFNDLNFQNGDYASCLWYSILSGIALLSSIVSCFDFKK